MFSLQIKSDLPDELYQKYEEQYTLCAHGSSVLWELGILVLEEVASSCLL